MNAIQNFAFEEHLVRVVDLDGEPWFVGKDVCQVLDLRNHNQVLSRLEDDEKGVHIVDPLGTFPRGGGPQEVVIVSEPGVYRMAFTSRKPEAERFKRWLAHEVLPQLRKTGVYALPSSTTQPPVLAEIAKDAPLAARVDAVRLAKHLFGAERARALWQELGLPHVPPPSPFHGAGEAAECLRLLLEHELRPGDSVRDTLLRAYNGELEAQAMLQMAGLRASEETDGFWISNQSRELAGLYARTPYALNKWQLLFRRLEGAIAGRKTIDGRQVRSVFLPIEVLDEEYLRSI